MKNRPPRPGAARGAAPSGAPRGAPQPSAPEAPESRRGGRPGGKPGGREQRGGQGGARGAGAENRAPGLLFGIHAVRAAWMNPERQVRRLIATANGLKALEGLEAPTPRPQPNIVEREEIERLLPPGAVHQGLVLDAAPLEEPTLDEFCLGAEARPTDLVAVLDQVTDPHNVGAVLRSAAAFGASALIVTERHAPPQSGTLAKSASGALEHVPLIRVGNLSQAIKQLQEAGYWCVGLAESGSRLLHELDLTGRTALVLGSEGEGMRRLTMERCDEVVRLPTPGVLPTLNISNAAAVALYEVARRRP